MQNFGSAVCVYDGDRAPLITSSLLSFLRCAFYETEILPIFTVRGAVFLRVMHFFHPNTFKTLNTFKTTITTHFYSLLI